MFVDENSRWPRPDPPRPRPSPPPRSEAAARLFLVFALLTALLPFSLGSCAALVRYVADRL